MTAFSLCYSFALFFTIFTGTSPLIASIPVHLHTSLESSMSASLVFDPPGADLSRALRRLHQEYLSVGLLESMSSQEFEVLVRKNVSQDELSDMFDGLNDADMPHLRTSLLGRAFGVKSDWRFIPADIVAQVNRVLAPLQRSVTMERLGRYTEPYNGRSWTVSQYRLKLSSGETVKWRATLLPGFIGGINELLKRGGVAGYFLGLQTDGDYYVFVYVTPQVEQRIAHSKLFRVAHESDPSSRLVQ